MAKYRKRPLVIEAIHFDGTEDSAVEVEAFAKDSTRLVNYRYNAKASSILMRIHTLEGIMIANPGDWIIKGAKGECYPCNPDIFDATYELVED